MITSYDVGDVVYLVESANIGALEPYAVESVRILSDGTTLYKLATGPSAPRITTPIGDRGTGRRILSLEVTNDQITTYCGAIELCKASLNQQLADITALESDCNGTGG